MEDIQIPKFNPAVTQALTVATEEAKKKAATPLTEDEKIQFELQELRRQNASQQRMLKQYRLAIRDFSKRFALSERIGAKDCARAVYDSFSTIQTQMESAGWEVGRCETIILSFYDNHIEDLKRENLK